jgi:hypothetical protein
VLLNEPGASLARLLKARLDKENAGAADANAEPAPADAAKA